MAIDKFGDHWSKPTVSGDMRQDRVNQDRAAVKDTKSTTDIILRESVLANKPAVAKDAGLVEKQPNVQPKTNIPTTTTQQSTPEKAKTDQANRATDARGAAESNDQFARNAARGLQGIVKPVDIEQQMKVDKLPQTTDPKQAPAAGGKNTVAVNPKAVPTSTKTEDPKNSTQQNFKAADTKEEAKGPRSKVQDEALKGKDVPRDVILSGTKDPANAGQVAAQAAGEMKKGDANEGKETKKDGKKIGKKEGAKRGKAKGATEAVYKDETNTTGRLGSLISGESPFDAEIDDATTVKPETESAVYDPGEWDVKSVAYNGDETYEMVRTRYLQHMQMTEKVVKDPMIKENWSDAPISERFIAETQFALEFANQIISELRLPKVAGGWGTRC